MPFAESYGVGDIIGVYLDYRRRKLEFFLNGKSMGAPYQMSKLSVQNSGRIFVQITAHYSSSTLS